MSQQTTPRDEGFPLYTNGLSPTVPSFGVPPWHRNNTLPPFPSPSRSVEATLGADSQKYRVAACYWFQMYKQSQAQLAELSKKQVEGPKNTARGVKVRYPKDSANITVGYLSTQPEDPDIYDPPRRGI
ncbi:hypothetical protein PG994_006966 [Apiospora phragmitis]|uniref:Uncharacterized protein n=1 Tax=Apiospora phragmitis TaxID=2905665 RepID=A0ABR1VGM7_9PEZI